MLSYIKWCHNPSFGLVTKARACKVAGWEGSLEVTSHAPENIGKCEGMNLHTPRWIPVLRVRVQIDSRIFKEQLKGSKTIGLTSLLYHWKALGM
jgi:hypothetical protein